MRFIWSKNRQNPSYPRDFSAVRSFGVPKKSNFRTAVYPPRMAPFGLKLWENAFQTIPDISFFDVEKKFRRNSLCYAHTAGLPWTGGLKSIYFSSRGVTQEVQLYFLSDAHTWSASLDMWLEAYILFNSLNALVLFE